MLTGLVRSTALRRRRAAAATTPAVPVAPAPDPVNKLTELERRRILDTLNSARFVDLAPLQVYAQLLDEGTYLCSVSTMYRVLRDNRQVSERRRLARHPAKVCPELVATAPRQVYSWDITKLAGPYKWTWYQLYVILDVFSRYVVAWLVAPRESARLAEELIADAIYRHDVDAGQLTLHADRGSSMTSKTVSQLLADLGVLQSHSRPHVSNDNPYSEAQFKTLKYSPTFPARFANLAAARLFCDQFFTAYNLEHHHSGLGLHTPHDVHYGLAETVRDKRQTILDAAYQAHPERFRHRPNAPRLPVAAWINPPHEEPIHTQAI